jgi:glycerol-3-phosphate dehydrogenase
MARNYGSKAEQIISEAASEQLRTMGDSHVLEAEVTHAIRNEMATSVADVVLRRTDLASGGLTDTAALDRCTDLVAAALQLTPQQAQEQKEAVARRIPGWT